MRQQIVFVMMVDPEANIIFGAVFNENMNEKVRVSVVATGIDGARPVQIPHIATDTVSSYSQLASKASEPSKDTVTASEKVNDYANTKVSQPMFPGGSDQWNMNGNTSTSKNISALETPKAVEQERASVDPTKVPESSKTSEVVNKTETVDDIVSQISIDSPAPQASTQAEKQQDDSSLKGFFGLMRNNKDEKEGNDKIAVSKTSQSSGTQKDDDNFEIPAFLRRSLY